MKKIILVLMLLIVHCTFNIENCESQVWSPLQSGVGGTDPTYVFALTVFNNELIAGGGFTTAGAVNVNNIAKWSGTTWSSLGSGLSGAGNCTFALTVFNNELIAAGTFTTAGGVSVNNIAKWNGTTWSPLGSGINNGIYALTVFNNELIAGGNFTTAGGVSVNNIAKWNGTTWSPLGSGVIGVNALSIFNNELIVGGVIDTTGGVSVKIAKWNGTTWSPLGNGVLGGPNPMVLALAIYNNELIAGGMFTTIGGVSANQIAKWNGTTWSPLSSGINDFVHSLTVFNNELIAGGLFSSPGSRIAKWNGTTWSSLGSGILYTSTPVPVVESLSPYNNELIAGGRFNGAGGITANNIAKWGWGGNSFTISGTVRYSDNNQPVTSGTVKAFKLDKNTANIIVLDSAIIQSNGTYTLPNVPQDSLDIGVFPNSSPPNDWVITYYPSTVYWENATVLYPTGNLTNINIGAIRMAASTNNNSVNGKVMRLNDNPLGNLKDAVFYAKSGNTFVRCAVSDGNGVYHLNSLPTGNLKILATRLGFSRDSVNVNVTSTSNIDSINFYLYRMYVGIKQINSTIPSEYKLFQNYPNPFNSMTNVKWQMLNAGNIKIVLYDVLGKEIVTLVNEKQSPGVYEVTFDANELPSGIYFYRLKAGEFIETKKMVLVK
jgi:hypothetical protein